MKTQAHTERARTRHHAALAALWHWINHGEQPARLDVDGLKLWRALRRIEAKAHRAAVRYCNDSSMTQAEKDKAKREAFEEVAAVFGAQGVPKSPPGLCFNWDGRGHTLKLDSDNPQTATIPQAIREDLSKDWGQDFILAAEID